MSEKSKLEQLMSLNVNDKTEKKNGLTYLSWAWAWAEFLKVYPDATYEVERAENGMPYVSNDSGACVFTNVTADGVTRCMWLPVMDNTNKAMKFQPYTYLDRYQKEKEVKAYTMFDINKTIMRCLTKNLGMFGLALYIFAGEDIPEEGEKQYKNPHEDASKKNEAVKDTFKARLHGAKSMEELDSAMKECEACFNTWPDAWIDGMNALFVKREKELK